jgi:macrodomain Ter protein organizer (MatP/YcbG family)
MSKMVRLDEDVYFALKARASKECRTLSAAVYALMHTADEHASTQKQLISLESQIKN